MTDPVEQSQMIEDCENRDDKLSDWERDFLDSLGRQLTDGRTLTDKQVEKLEAIWEMATS